MNIREASENDFDAIWPIFNDIVSIGETYAYPKETTKSDALKIRVQLPRKTYAVEDNNQILGTYYIKTNQAGPGDHVCNCGYMVSSKARGKGLATAMCEHSQKVAIELGYKAMQFNFVASSRNLSRGGGRETEDIEWLKGFVIINKKQGVFRTSLSRPWLALVRWHVADVEVRTSSNTQPGVTVCCAISVICQLVEFLYAWQITIKWLAYPTHHINLTIIAPLVTITAAIMLAAVMPANRLISLLMVWGSGYDFAHISFHPVTFNVIEC